MDLGAATYAGKMQSPLRYRAPDTSFNVYGETVPASNVYFLGTPPTHSPGWAVPLAVLIGVAGLGSAAFVLRRR